MGFLSLQKACTWSLWYAFNPTLRQSCPQVPINLGTKGGSGAAWQRLERKRVDLESNARKMGRRSNAFPGVVLDDLRFCLGRPPPRGPFDLDNHALDAKRPLGALIFWQEGVGWLSSPRPKYSECSGPNLSKAYPRIWPRQPKTRGTATSLFYSTSLLESTRQAPSPLPYRDPNPKTPCCRRADTCNPADIHTEYQS